MQGRPLDGFATEGFEAPTQPERALWVSVILQQLRDAMSTSTLRDSKLAKRIALLWFERDFGDTHQDFCHVCELAGLEPAWVRAQALRVIHAGKPLNELRLRRLLQPKPEKIAPAEETKRHVAAFRARMLGLAESYRAGSTIRAYSQFNARERLC